MDEDTIWIAGAADGKLRSYTRQADNTLVFAEVVNVGASGLRTRVWGAARTDIFSTLMQDHLLTTYQRKGTGTYTSEVCQSYMYPNLCADGVLIMAIMSTHQL